MFKAFFCENPQDVSLVCIKKMTVKANNSSDVCSIYILSFNRSMRCSFSRIFMTWLWAFFRSSHSKISMYCVPSLGKKRSPLYLKRVSPIRLTCGFRKNPKNGIRRSANKYLPTDRVSQWRLNSYIIASEWRRNICWGPVERKVYIAVGVSKERSL